MLHHKADRIADTDHGPRVGLREWTLAAPAVAISWLAVGPMAAACSAIVAPALMMLAARMPRGWQTQGITSSVYDHATLLPLRAAAVLALDAALRKGRETGRHTAALVVTLDDAQQISDRYGLAAYDSVLRKCGERLLGSLRENDGLTRLDGPRFAVTLAPARRLDLETMIQIATRLQMVIAPPFSIDACTLFATSSVGFCLSQRAPAASGESLLAAAEQAGNEAARCGPSAVRSYSSELERATSKASGLRDDIETALESGQIVAHFQPQMSTDTGAISGFEVLARWSHPERGMILPTEFMPHVHAAGLSTRLGEVMLYHALTALKAWDLAGLSVPTVAVNFSKEELGDPKLAEKLKWELDRFELPASRLTVEILESVVADADTDVVVRNVASLAALGCPIDLDDFGTGHASIASIRRFSVDRIKIDRSLVTRVDSDEQQRQMISAILSMAERLDVSTLAEGVETLAEHSMLAQLGCSHVQGFAVARPMPFEDTCAWLERHDSKLKAAPKLGRRAS
jgi:diguanylate cyclase